MDQSIADQLRDELARAEARAAAAETRVELLEAEVQRAREWRKSALLAVVVVALLAILMLGIVAFNAVDDQTSLQGLA